jgi:uncharacterized protein (UPF0333 family)
MSQKKLLKKRGQAIIQYAMLAAMVTAATSAMVVYVFRAVQATQQMIDTESREQ